jgi:carboxyl-terminal processing protease
MRRVAFLAVSGALLLGAFVGGYALAHRAPKAREAVVVPSVVDAVRMELAAHYYRPVPARVLRLRTVSSILAALHDPYTEYLDRRSYDLLRRELARSYSGIGVTLLPAAQGLVVVGLQPGPARHAGLEQGDTIVRVGARSAVGLGGVAAAALLRGPTGAPIRLEVRRHDVLLRLEVRPARVDSPNVAARVIKSGGRRYGYVSVLWFGSGTSTRVASALRRFVAAHVDGVVVDLRDDPGGLLVEAVRTASLFLHGGSVVTLVGAHSPRHTYRASVSNLVPRLRVALLVDGGTASSAEVLAAALQDNGRATVVGTRTFGKAVVQTLEPLAGGGALALTTARYLTPAGEDISRRGVTPDVVVRDDPRTHVDDVLAAGIRAIAAAR